MTFSNILSRISDLVHVFFPGYNGVANRITPFVNAIINHPIILFFVLSSLIFVGIRILKRMVHL